MTNFYFTPQGQADAGEYITNDGDLITGKGGCNVVLSMPCPLPKKCNQMTLNITKQNCEFNMCEMTTAIKSIANSTLLQADKAAALNPALTAAQKLDATDIANNILPV
jgi:hypothetical protein